MNVRRHPPGTASFRPLLMGLLFAMVSGHALGADGAVGAIQAVPVEVSAVAGASDFDAIVEAGRQTTLAAQVSGAVADIAVRPGDRVRAGQVLLRLDAHAADQTAVAGQAQAEAAEASASLAQRDFERQRHLFEKGYISQSAFDRAQAQLKATQAQMQAHQAQAGAARTASGYYAITAPYAGVISEVPVNPGDMAMPGRALITVYDPDSLRVTARVPQSAVKGVRTQATIEIPGTGAALVQRVVPGRVQILPAADPATHTIEVRLELPRSAGAMVPGTFARLWVANDTAGVPEAHFFVPASTVVRRTEMNGVYVVDGNGKPHLRQVRVGDARADKVEILSGLSATDKVAADPQAAARVR